MANVNRNIVRSVAAPASVSAGSATDIADIFPTGMSVYLYSVGTGTYQLQISANGTNWVNMGSPLTAAGSVVVSQCGVAVRWNCTAYTSGTPTSEVCGGPI